MNNNSHKQSTKISVKASKIEELFRRSYNMNE